MYIRTDKNDVFYTQHISFEDNCCMFTSDGIVIKTPFESIVSISKYHPFA